MASKIHTAVDFYERHPISAQIILTKLEAARGTLNGLRPDELFPHDQDHYGGTAANDALAKCAHIGHGTKVVDLCAGLGGPARYLAHRYGAFVTGVELTPARVAGAAELTQRVGLSSQVKVVEGNVTALPLPDASQDAVVSQEDTSRFRRSIGFDPAPFCAAPRPNQKMNLSIAVQRRHRCCFVAALGCLRLR